MDISFFKRFVDGSVQDVDYIQTHNFLKNINQYLQSNFLLINNVAGILLVLYSIASLRKHTTFESVGYTIEWTIAILNYSLQEKELTERLELTIKHCSGANGAEYFLSKLSQLRAQALTPRVYALRSLPTTSITDLNTDTSLFFYHYRNVKGSTIYFFNVMRLLVLKHSLYFLCHKEMSVQ